MALPGAAVAPLTRRYQAGLVAVSTRAVPIVAAAWAGLDSYDEDVIDEFATAITPTMDAVKRGAVAQSTGYLNALFSTAVTVDAARVSSTFDPRDPFAMVWRGLARGVPWDEAVAAGARQIEATVSHFTMSSARRTGDEYASRAGRDISGWRRVPNRGACEWCQQVAGDHYRSAESADFGHLRCGCTAVPIVDGYDPSGDAG